MLNSQTSKKNTDLLHFITVFLLKTRQHRDVRYDVIDELRRLSLSKCFPVLCHKSKYEVYVAIFPSINRETCDKYIYG